MGAIDYRSRNLTHTTLNSANDPSVPEYSHLAFAIAVKDSAGIAYGAWSEVVAVSNDPFREWTLPRIGHSLLRIACSAAYESSRPIVPSEQMTLKMSEIPEIIDLRSQGQLGYCL